MVLLSEQENKFYQHECLDSVEVGGTLLIFLRIMICEGTFAAFLFNSLLFALGPGGHGTEIYSGTVLRNRAARERNRTRGMKKVILQ